MEKQASAKECDFRATKEPSVLLEARCLTLPSTSHKNEATKSLGTMKLRKSRFRFGSFAFGSFTSNSDLVSGSSQSNRPLSSHRPLEGRDSWKNDEKYRSTSSILRSESSKADCDSNSTPILLAVRKRSCSDSGLDESSVSSQNCSPNANEERRKVMSSKNSEGSSKIGKGGFFKMFHKSATLLFKHPTAELNPNKPYKGTMTLSRDRQLGSSPDSRTRCHTLGAALRTSEEYSYYKRHLQWPPNLSSVSSLSSRQEFPLEGDVLDSAASSSRAAQAVPKSAKASSSSNSVISTCSSEGSNYDSGAFSRTSTPEAHFSQQAKCEALNLSTSRLTLCQPLTSPSLVLAACMDQYSLNDQPCDLLSCASLHQQSDSLLLVRKSDQSDDCSDVSVTIGANKTKLTISPMIGSDRGSIKRRSGKLRRSRSGLPVLGTTALHQSDCLSSSSVAANSSPSKKLLQRNRISTVYLNISGNGSQSPQKSQVSRSESSVTVSTTVNGGHPGADCNCQERVTVNGQHHCCPVSQANINDDFDDSMGRLVRAMEKRITRMPSKALKHHHI